ncbi:CHASE2 domain-containing protein [Treponema sp.]
MNKRKTNHRLLIIPLAVGGIFAIVNLFGAWSYLELVVYDVFLHLKPAVTEDSSIILLNVDEESIVRTGAWPWPRGLMARGLETLAEIDASYAIFDIEYLEKSPMSVDRNYLEGGLKTEFDGFFDEVGSNVGSLFNAISNGSLPFKDAGEYGNQLIQLMDDGKTSLYKKTEQVAVENDTYLGQSMRLFGGAYITLNLQKTFVSSTPVELREFAINNFSYPRIEVKSDIQTENKDFLVPIKEISSYAKNAGFTNVKIDEDGVRRRIRLVETIDGKSYLQLAFSPLVRKLGEPDIVVEKNRILLKGATIRGKKTDIRIPLDETGHMLIRWPKKKYEDSFAPHVSFYRLLEFRENQDALVANLRALATMESWALVSGANPVRPSLDARYEADAERKKTLEEGSPEQRAIWLTANAAFKAEVAKFLSEGWDSRMADLLKQAKAASPVEDGPFYDDYATRFADIYRNCVEAVSILDKSEKELRDRLAGSFCIIGWTGTATTDMGANPFDEQYINVGTHAAVANTILQQDFLQDAPEWVGSILALLISLGAILFIERLKTLHQMIVGIGATLAVFFGSYAIFHFTGIHIPTLAPTLATFLSFLSYTIATFLVSEREKSFLRKAFGTYLSGDVINQIIADPTMLKLGGQKMWMTAMFTDVRGFSTISEVLDPEQLVKLLNLYLSGMSDRILENRGTIDKYEGDAIISFFGAPLSYPEHAREACYSAVMMKRKEAELNAQFMADGLTPNPLLTRIGLNTGDMVVGNMGTERKMDYTIMGNAVNLAARLEGVNKQYGSWVLASDVTKREAGDEFITRRLDRVRVVGINTPVQLWEIIDLRTDADDQLLDFLDRFEKAKVVFDIQDWTNAAKLFGALLEEKPTDGPSATYKRRSEEFLKKAPAANWDGVFSLNEK